MATPTIFILGAGHVGRAVAELATWLEIRTVVWDDRAELLAGVECADVLLDAPIAEALDEEPVTAATAVVVVTRNVELDLEILPHLLATGAHYVGVMGSKRRWETTRTQLSELGVAEADLDRINSPIGVEIAAETPEEIAVSILAEIVGDRPAP